VIDNIVSVTPAGTDSHRAVFKKRRPPGRTTVARMCTPGLPRADLDGEKLVHARQVAGAVDALREHRVAVVADVARAVEADVEPVGADVHVAGAV
jgi:hypothetical protein